MEGQKKKRKYRGLRIFGRILLGIFAFLILLLLFIRSPWGQNIIKDQLISSITNKTNTTIEVDRLFITFSGNIFVDGLYLEDQKGDTLLFSKELEADIPLWPIIQGDGIAINSIEWEGVRANVIRKDTIDGFNFSFLAEAFAASDTTTTAQDTTSGGMNFTLGDIELRNFDVVYNDAVTGAESRFLIKQLDLEMESLDLENMKFHASQGAISNSTINYKIIPFEKDPDAEAPPMPELVIDELNLNNVKLNFESVPDSLLANLDVYELYLELPKADLQNNIFDVNNLVLNKSEVFIKTSTLNKETTDLEEESTSSEAFTWPEIEINVAEISLNQNQIVFLNNKEEINPQVFEPDALAITDLVFEAKNLVFQNQIAKADIQDFSFTETSGIHLNQLAFTTNLNDTSFELDDLVLNLNGNKIRGNMAATYTSFQNFLENPENSRIALNLPEFYVDLKDLFLIQPELRKNEYLLALSKKNMSGRLRAQGTLAAMQIPAANVNWGRTTSVAVVGSLYNLSNPENLRFNVPRFDAESTRTDLSQFVDEEQIGIAYPENIALNGSIAGTVDDMEAEAELITSSGNIILDGGFTNTEEIAFNAELQTVELDLGKILQNEQLGQLNLNLSSTGSGETINTLDASLDANISSFAFNQYQITNLEILGEFVDGNGMVNMDYDDGNINTDMEAFVVLDSVAPLVNLSWDLTGANLQLLGISQRDIRVGFEMGASFRGNFENYDINAEVIDGVAVFNDQTYLLGNLGTSARIRSDSTALDIRNRMLDLSLRSNTDPASFVSALQQHFRSYLNEEIATDTVQKPVNLQLDAEIREQPILSEVFLTGLEEMDTIDIQVDFQQEEKSLYANVSLPFVEYTGMRVDTLGLQMYSNEDNIDFNLGFLQLEAGPLAIQETALEGQIADSIFQLDFNSWYEGELLMHIPSKISRRDGNVVFNLEPAEVIFNSKRWEAPETNEILFTENATEFTDFSLIRANQRLEITDELEGRTTDHIAISFNNFNLANIMAYLNPERPLLAGNLNGNFTIEEPRDNTGLDAGLQIDELSVLDVSLGTLSMNAEPAGGNNYDFDLAVKGDNVDLDLTGGFYATETEARWETTLDLNEVQMKVIEGFSLGEITETSGSFSGDIQLAGSLAEPEYEGNLHFNNAAFTVATLDAPFEFPNESLQLNEEGIYFDAFTIQDENDNNLSLNGEVLTSTLLNPTFNLYFDAQDFMLLNSTREDNSLYFGTLVVDANGQVSGDLNLPQIELDLSVDSESDFTYIIPASEVGIQERQGVVMFVNKENPDAILTQAEEESFTLTGFAINSNIEINEDAVFNVIVNEETNDNLQVIGAGNLNFNIYTNGRTTLSGRYTMSGGHYEMSLYNLVSRRFEIVDGSSITWLGDPMDASLDVRASYEVETSANSLMAAQISGTGSSVRNRFRQELPFIVYLNVGGELMQPVLTFGLDMPEEEQGAIGGEVYGRIQQLNQQEQELNRQVFSLLVLNRFYPEGTNDGSGGGTLAIARDNLNNALSDQLNLVSNNLLGDSGFELNFGLDSYTDYQGTSPEERTQLDIAAQKTFMDERLVVSVGSEVDIQGSNQNPQEENPLIGNVSIEYLLTENGRFRLKGFRRNTYENVIDGQVIMSGLALIFTREFNKFSELWKGLRNDEEEE